MLFRSRWHRQSGVSEVGGMGDCWKPMWMRFHRCCPFQNPSKKRYHQSDEGRRFQRLPSRHRETSHQSSFRQFRTASTISIQLGQARWSGATYVAKLLDQVIVLGGVQTRPLRRNLVRPGTADGLDGRSSRFRSRRNFQILGLKPGAVSRVEIGRASCRERV